MEKMTVPLALEKLAALGDKDHIALHLAEKGLKGRPGATSSCIVARHLIAECPGVRHVSVSVNSTGSASQTSASWTDVEGYCFVSLPAVVNELAVAFDRGEYPELVEASE